MMRVQRRLKVGRAIAECGTTNALEAVRARLIETGEAVTEAMDPALLAA